MAIFRVEKVKDYTVMANYHLKDKRLSLKAKGLLSMMLSLPEEWDYTQKGLSLLSCDGVDSVRDALHELKETGYIQISQSKDENGKFSNSVYDVYEQPLLEKPLSGKPFSENPITGKPITGNPISEKPLSENPTQLNTYILNTNISNTKELRETQKRFQKPKVEEIKNYCDERNNGIDPQRFYDFYEARGWKVGKNKMSDWKACIRTWEKDTPKPAEQPSFDASTVDEYLKNNLVY